MPTQDNLGGIMYHRLGDLMFNVYLSLENIHTTLVRSENAPILT
jgi:hypothetical protein